MKKLKNLDSFFLLVIFCAPLYLIKVSIFSIPSNVFELLALLAIVLAVIQERENFLSQFFKLPKLLVTSCTLILVGVLFSIFFNKDQLAGLGILKSWFLIPMFFSFALYCTLNSELSVRKVFGSVYFSTITISCIALVYKFLGITTYDNRLNAFYLSPNHLAMYLAPGVFFGLYFLLKSFSQSKFSKQTILHFFYLLLIFIALYYTYSYGTWLAVFFSLAILLFIQFCHSRVVGNPDSLLLNARGWISHHLPESLRESVRAGVRDDKHAGSNLVLGTLFLFIFAIILFASQLSTQKFSDLRSLSDRSSLASRQTIWQVAFLLVKENPVVGIGPGNFQTAYLALQPRFSPYLEWAVPEPHNIFLAFWLQAGLLGFIGFLLTLFFVFQTLWKILKDKKNTALAVPLLGFFLYTIFHGLIDTPYWKNDLAFLFWLCLFLALSLLRLSQKNNYN